MSPCPRFPKADIQDFAPSPSTPVAVANIPSINAQTVWIVKYFEYKSWSYMTLFYILENEKKKTNKCTTLMKVLYFQES